ncbi:hypothetical protein [Nesterenkonia alba]|uniref:hypothetical protein n=1 Tax=Nesterenkonia alba TaxID=515814 RepID=UPI0003B3640E|nr:hypothetical protein [Nesterenkonia alba]
MPIVVKGGGVINWGALVELLAGFGIIGGMVGLLSWLQTRSQDARVAWWERTKWAIAEVKSDNIEDQIMGGRALRAIARARMTQKVDMELFRVIYERAVFQTKDTPGMTVKEDESDN